MNLDDTTMTTTTTTLTPHRPEERDGVHAALHGDLFDRLRVAYRAMRALLANPEDTEQTFVLAAALDRDHIPKPFFRFMVDERGYALMRDQPAIDTSSIDYDALARLPEGTLGRSYARHLAEGALDPDLFGAPPNVPTAIAYLAKRLRQTHDIWHVLTGHGTDIAGEVALQGFAFGQLGTPAPGLTAVAGAIRCLFFEKHGLRAVRRTWQAYRRGKRAAFLLVVRWEDHWSDSVASLRERYGIVVDRTEGRGAGA